MVACGLKFGRFTATLDTVRGLESRLRDALPLQIARDARGSWKMPPRQAPADGESEEA
jgi:hypothetical protein